jgi:hypothetical protein
MVMTMAAAMTLINIIPGTPRAMAMPTTVDSPRNRQERLIGGHLQ